MEDVFELIFRPLKNIVAYLLVELIFECLIKIPGSWIVRGYSRKQNIQGREFEIVVMGFLFWACVVTALTVIFR